MIVKLLLILLFVCVGAAGVLWLGSVASLDHQYRHTEATMRLPEFSHAAAAQPGILVSRIVTDGWQFRVRSAGFGGTRGNVIMLHGFPETSAMWEVPLRALADAGYQVLAFDQRGYSPGARPVDVDAYAIDELTTDVFTLADAVGFERFHLVGHDWGAGVGWSLVLQSPERVDSWTSLSIPHLLAYGQAMLDDPDQQQRSSYIGFFRTPWIPELLFTFNRLKLLKTAVYGDHGGATLGEYLSVFSEPGALTAALNWYRAGELAAPANQEIDPHIDLPVLFIWGRDDPVVGQASLDAQRPYFTGPYRELALDTGHWLMQTEPETVTGALLSFLDSVDHEP